jgi:recombination protein RecT
MTTKQLTIADSLSNQIQTMKPQFELALPKHIDASKFIRVAQTVIKTNPNLQKCTPTSIYAGLLKCAQDGLYIDGSTAALVPFGDQAQYMVMLQGILTKIRNSGLVSSIMPEVVYENDTFEYYIDENGKHFKHVPNFEGDRGEIKLVYSVAKLKDGDVYVEVMSKADIEKVRQSSRAKNGIPWTQWWSEMAKKSVVRRQAKYLPNSTDLESMFKSDDEIETTARDVAAPVATALAAPAKKGPSKLKSILKDVTPEQEPVIEPEQETEKNGEI